MKLGSKGRAYRRRDPSYGRGRAQLWFVAALAIFAGASGWALLAYRSPAVPERAVTERPLQIPTGGYVSSQTCRGCHPSQYSTWHGSFHRTMTQLATPESVRASFDGVAVDDVADNPMRLSRKGGEFFAEFNDPDWDGDGNQPPRITRRVVMITGSHQQQAYWYATGHDREIGQLPAMYLIGERRWVPRESAFLQPPGGTPPSQTGRWKSVCIDCHTTHGNGSPVAAVAAAPSPSDAAASAAEFGIACEACHGPGAEHVAANRSPLRRYWSHLTGGGDTTTVHPTRLEPQISSQVCGQCHGVWTPHLTESDAPMAVPRYTPGGELKASRFVVQPTRNADAPTMKRVLESYPEFLRDSFWPDGMIRVSGREYNGLIDSPCFTGATEPGRTLTCFSCHTMHKADGDPRSTAAWAGTHQVSAGMEGNEACLQCHPTLRANITAHTKHKLESSGSSCYNCHMPYTTYGLLRALRSHQVSSPSVTTSLHSGRPNACNLCHLDKSLGWTADRLETWYDVPKPPLDHEERDVSASLLWLLRGDAGQRALIGWSMGWEPAREASGSSWMAPYLTLLMEDPYDAVRFIAGRSLRSLPGYAGFTYDFVAPPAQRSADSARAMDLWARQPASARRTDPALLMNVSGEPRRDEWVRLFRQRNDRDVYLNE